MSDRIIFDKAEWFDVTLYLECPEAVADVWVDLIEERIETKNIDFVRKTFFMTGIYLHRRNYGKNVKAKEIYSLSGYSKSTFHRIFDNFPAFQLRLYHFLTDIVIDIYREALNLRERTPNEFCRFSRDCIISSHLAAPKSLISDLYRINSPISPEHFHPYVPRVAEVMFDYIRAHRNLGFREFSQRELTAVIRTLDYDILFSKVSEFGDFPTFDQAHRLERMLLAYVSQP